MKRVARPDMPHTSCLMPSRLESAPVRKLSIVFCALLVANACGKRGDPRPPVPVIPKATSDVVVTQRGSKVILTWSDPSLTTSGQTLRDLRRVVVYRVTEELPVPQAGRDPNAILPGDIDVTQPRPIAQFAKIPGVSAAQFVKLREKLDGIEGANLPAATAGAHLIYEDTPATTTLKDLQPPSAPASLTALVEVKDVRLIWDPVDVADLWGYFVYRYQGKYKIKFQTGAPIPSTHFSDASADPGIEYVYAVTAVDKSGNESAERRSEPVLVPKTP